MQVVAPMSKMRSVHNALLHLGHDSRFIFVIAFHIRPFACRYARTMHAWHASKLACAHARSLTCWPRPRPPFSLSPSLMHTGTPRRRGCYLASSKTYVLHAMPPLRLKSVRYSCTHVCVCVCVFVVVFVFFPLRGADQSVINQDAVCAAAAAAVPAAAAASRRGSRMHRLVLCCSRVCVCVCVCACVSDTNDLY